MGRVLKALAALLGAVVIIALVAGGWFWSQLNASVPDYEGELALSGLTAPVTVERDALGVVTIHSEDIHDEARALGFVHAQERFFQMDLLRRSAAGELAALVGAGAVPMDEARRIHQLRRTAERFVASAPADYRALLDAYAEGVNAGVAALGAKPFEYFLLRADPAPWTPADSVLAVGAMFFDLQGGHALHERHELVAREALPPAIADFLYPDLTEGDAPIDGSESPPAVIPSASDYDLRSLPVELFGEPIAPRAPPPVGSNNWAVAGAHTESGRGLVANDMHLGLQVPSIWFRAELQRDGRRVTGVTLPGTPLIVVGSNGSVAWGFTNSYGDWLDLIVLETDELGRYRAPDGWHAFDVVSSPIAVAGGVERAFEFRTTIWGPVLGELPDGRPYAVRWVAHDPRAYAPGFMDLAGARSVDEAIAAANRSGIPHQNFVVADADGNIGWTIMGQIPELPADEYPRVVNPDHGRVWTANSRVVGGDRLAKVGDGSYAYGHRAAQIRERLFALDKATPADMLAIQLDDESLFHRRWRDELLALLDDATVADDARYGAVRDAIAEWNGHAAVDSVGFRLVRGWRNTVVAHALSALTAEVRAADEDWHYRSFRSEAWAWPLVRDEPMHLLDPRYAAWRDLKLAALDELLESLGVATATDIAERPWGTLNTVRVQHPLSQAVPLIGRWLDMPAQALPGETYTPRVQGVRFGASQRMAVSPGDEANGYFHMPGGQSGHPRSPYYGAGHDDWAEGRPTPFLPGNAERTLRLTPPVDEVRVTPVPLPSGAGAVAPNASNTPDGSLLLSWIEPVGGGHVLKFARMQNREWSVPRTIATGDRWFVNWADFPALVELVDGTLVAHWLQKSGPSTYAYDVMVTRSVDGGESWSAPERPHDDGTQTEHGFVSLLPVDDGSVRVVWLDGRETSGGHDGHGGGAMTLRTRTLTADGVWGDSELLDASVCDCCQTAAVATNKGVTVAYRGRTDDEIRDLLHTSLRNDGWSAPRALRDDGWQINACPVNGPALATDGKRVVATWFTGSGNVPRTFVSFSEDGGNSFGEPVLLEEGTTLGRVHAVMLSDGSALTSRLDGGDAAAIRVQRVHADGRTDQPVVVAQSSAARASGFPRLARVGNDVLVVWTEPGGLRAARVSLPSTR
ncbi:MAG: penicillin acylase family protein [Gammaproteobacteria bacterium]